MKTKIQEAFQMKRTLAFTLAMLMALILLLAGCGKGIDKNSNTSDNPAPTTTSSSNQAEQFSNIIPNDAVEAELASIAYKPDYTALESTKDYGNGYKEYTLFIFNDRACYKIHLNKVKVDSGDVVGAVGYFSKYNATTDTWEENKTIGVLSCNHSENGLGTRPLWVVGAYRQKQEIEDILRQTASEEQAQPLPTSTTKSTAQEQNGWSKSFTSDYYNEFRRPARLAGSSASQQWEVWENVINYPDEGVDSYTYSLYVFNGKTCYVFEVYQKSLDANHGPDDSRFFCKYDIYNHDGKVQSLSFPLGAKYTNFSIQRSTESGIATWKIIGGEIPDMLDQVNKLLQEG